MSVFYMCVVGEHWLEANMLYALMPSERDINMFSYDEL